MNWFKESFIKRLIEQKAHKPGEIWVTGGVVHAKSPTADSDGKYVNQQWSGADARARAKAWVAAGGQRPDAADEPTKSGSAAAAKKPASSTKASKKDTKRGKSSRVKTSPAQAKSIRKIGSSKKTKSVTSRPEEIRNFAAEELANKMSVLSGGIKSVGQGLTAAGPVHETTVGLMLDDLSTNPDMSPDELIDKWTTIVADTGLGRTLLGPGKRDGSEKTAKLRKLIALAYQTAYAEHIRAQISIRAAGLTPDTSETISVHGNQESKNRLEKQLQDLKDNGYEIVSSEGVVISDEDLPEMIQGAGSSRESNSGMSTPADAFVVTIDPKTKKAILGLSSYKTDREDPSFNSTVLKELTDYRASIKQLIRGGGLKDSDVKRIQKQLDTADEVIRRLSDNITDVFATPVDRLISDKAALSDFRKWVEKSSTSGITTDKNIEEYHESAIRKFSEPPKNTTSETGKFRHDSLVAAGWKPGTKITPAMAQAAWLQSMRITIDRGGRLPSDEQKLVSRFFYSPRGKKHDVSVDTTQVRMKALKALQDRHKALGKINCRVGDSVIPASRVVMGLFAVKALHLQESFSDIPGVSPNSVYQRYRCSFKAVTGDIVGYPSAIRSSLGVDSFEKFCSNLTLSPPRLQQRKGGSEGEVGGIVFDFVYTRKDGVAFPILIRTIRTKGGSGLTIVVRPSREYVTALAKNQPTPESNESVLMETAPSYYARFKGVPPEILDRPLTYNPIDQKTGRMRTDKKTGAPKISTVKLSNVLFTPSKYEKYPALVAQAHSIAGPYLDKDQKDKLQKHTDKVKGPPPAKVSAPIHAPQSTGTGISHQKHPAAIQPKRTKIKNMFPTNHYRAFKNSFELHGMDELLKYKPREDIERHLALLLMSILVYKKKDTSEIIEKYFHSRKDTKVLHRLAEQIVEQFPLETELTGASVGSLATDSADILFQFDEDKVNIVDFDRMARGLKVVSKNKKEEYVLSFMKKIFPMKVFKQESTYFILHDIVDSMQDLSLFGEEMDETTPSLIQYGISGVNKVFVIQATRSKVRAGAFVVTFTEEFTDLLGLSNE